MKLDQDRVKHRAIVADRASERDPGDTIATLSSNDRTLDDDTALGSDETVRHDPDRPVESTSRVQRGRRTSVSKIGRYTIVRELGRGGMGQVYEADDPELGRRVAIKVLREDRSNERYMESLRREAQALAKLVHPNVVTVHDVGLEDGQLFVVMRLVDGKTIDVWAREHPDPTKIVELFRQAGRGLAAAHAAGLVHCDFKPGNVLVDREGVAQVGDFGLVRVAEPAPVKKRASTIAGTPFYMAPEQFDGEATPASDQFSFCVSLWEILTGERPYEDIGIDDHDKAAARSLKPPRNMSPQLARVLIRGLSPAPEDRYPSMDALLDALSPPRSRVLPFAIGGAVVAAGGITLALSLGGHDDPTPVAAPPPAPPGIPDGAPRKLTTYEQAACAYSPTIEPNGDVIFDRTAGDAVDLYRVPASGGPPQQLTTGPEWEWRAHPGRRAGEVVHLIHPTTNVDAQQIAMLDIATRKDTPVANVLAIDAVAIKDAIHYIVRTGHEIRTRVGRHDTVLVAASEGYTFAVLAASPDGTHLAVNARRKDRTHALCIVDIAVAKLTCEPVETDEARPAFSADSRFVYFSGYGIRRRDLATRKDTLAIPDVRARGGLAVSPDGKTMVWSNCGDQQSIIDIGAPTKPIVDDGLYPALSAKRLAWVRRTDGSAILMTRGEDGRDFELTRSNFGAVSAPAIAPDNRHITFVARAPHAGIHSMSTEMPDNIQLVSDDPRDHSPAWLDGDTIAFQRDLDEHTTAIYTVPIDGGTPRLITKDRTLRGASNGKLLVNSNNKLYWIDPKTKRETPGPILESSGGIGFLALSPNGRWLMYLQGIQGQEVFRVSVPTNKTERLGSIAGGSTARSGAITDDGNVMVGATTWAGDLYTVNARPGTTF